MALIKLTANSFLREHPFLDPVTSPSPVQTHSFIFPGDEIVFYHDVVLPDDLALGVVMSDIVLVSAKVSLIAQKPNIFSEEFSSPFQSTRNFTLDSYQTQFNNSNAPVVLWGSDGYANLLTERVDRNFRLPAGDFRRQVKFTTLHTPSTNKWTLRFFFPLLFRWEYWKPLAGVSNDFYDANQNQNGLNNFWFRYFLPTTWKNIKSRLDLDLLVQGSPQKVRSELLLTPNSDGDVNNYGTNPDWTNKSIKTSVVHGTPSNTPCLIKSNEDTEVFGYFQKVSGWLSGEQGNISAVVWIEPFEGGGITARTRASSLYPVGTESPFYNLGTSITDDSGIGITTDAGDYIIIDGSGNGVQILFDALAPQKVTAFALINYVKLAQIYPGITKFTLYVRLYNGTVIGASSVSTIVVPDSGFDSPGSWTITNNSDLAASPAATGVIAGSMIDIMTGGTPHAYTEFLFEVPVVWTGMLYSNARIDWIIKTGNWGTTHSQISVGNDGIGGTAALITNPLPNRTYSGSFNPSDGTPSFPWKLSLSSNGEPVVPMQLLSALFTIHSDGYGTKKGEELKQDAMLITMPVTSSGCAIRQPDCPFNLDVFATKSGVPDLENDKTDFYESGDNYITAITLTLQKNSNTCGDGAWVDVKTFTDNGYGKFFAFGLSPDFLGSNFIDDYGKKYTGLFLKWSAVLNDVTMDIGFYRMKISKTNTSGDTTVYYDRRQFCLKEYSCNLANGSVRIETLNEGTRGEIQSLNVVSDGSVESVTSPVDYAGGWNGQIRVPGIFIFKDADSTKEFNQYGETQMNAYRPITNELKPKFALAVRPIPMWLHFYLMTNVLQADTILMTDYNNRNVNPFVKTIVISDGGYAPKDNNLANPLSSVDIPLAYGQNNLRKRNSQ